jgi:tetratricopeptide (TPR) repeat protein
VFLLAPTAHVATYAGKIEDAKEEVRKNPDDASAHFNLGKAYYELGKHQEAIESFKQAIRIDPDDALAHYNLACCYSLLGNVSKALKSLGKAIDLGFDNIKHMESDSDLDGLRDEAGYKKLINKLKS